jgi:hypothetical protein
VLDFLDSYRVGGDDLATNDTRGLFGMTGETTGRWLYLTTERFAFVDDPPDDVRQLFLDPVDGLPTGEAAAAAFDPNGGEITTTGRIR